MASKRMLSMNIVDTDMFLQMPISARLLYYDFCMRADDDGFIDAPFKILKMIGCSEDDLRILISKNYLIPFESRVCVIRHWLIHNTIRKDRYNPTIHIAERNSLELRGKTYEIKGKNENGNQLATNWQPSIEENRIDTNSSNNIEVDENGKNIYEIIEGEFGKLISPLEYEVINSWTYNIDVLKLAVKEASTSNNLAIKYIDKILYNWKHANVKSLEDAIEYIRKFNQRKEKKNNLPEKQAETTGASYYRELDD